MLVGMLVLYVCGTSKVFVVVGLLFVSTGL